MSTSQEAPALIQYACERCKTQFVLPPSSRKLKITGKFKALGMGLGRTFKLHEGLGTGIDTARRQLLAKMDDEAYQSFVQSFRFCHECRQFVCNDCWSTSRRSCLTCVAKSMTGTVRPRAPFVPTGPEIPRPVIAAVVPRKGRMRRDLALVALALAIVLVSLEAGILLVNATGATANASPTEQAVAAGTTSPGDSTTASTSENLSSPTATASATPTDTPTEMPSPTWTPSLAPGVSASPRPLPLITCGLQSSDLYVNDATAVSCSWTNPWFGTPTRIWYSDNSSNGSSNWWSSLTTGTHRIHLHAGQNNSFLDSNYVTIHVTAAPTLPPGATPTPIITPAPSPAPTTPPVPYITCDGSTGSNTYTAGDTAHCSVTGGALGGLQTWHGGGLSGGPNFASLPVGTWSIYVNVNDGTFNQDSANYTINVNPAPTPPPTTPAVPQISCDAGSYNAGDTAHCSFTGGATGGTVTWSGDLSGGPDFAGLTTGSWTIYVTVDDGTWHQTSPGYVIVVN